MVKRLKDEGTRAQVILSGALAGLVSRFVVAPLDVVKIRLQLQSHSLSDPLSAKITGPTYKGTVGTLRRILRDEGLTVSSPVWKAAPALVASLLRSLTISTQGVMERKYPG
jgi:Mitochondrial carrier protein